MQFDRQHWSGADSATIITLPATPVLPIRLEETDLALRGFHFAVSGAAQLAALFALLDGAAITRTGGPAAFSVLRIKISLTNRNATVAKLLFDGLPRADGSIVGTVNGQPVLARATLCRQLRAWVSAQRELADECRQPG